MAPAVVEPANGSFLHRSHSSNDRTNDAPTSTSTSTAATAAKKGPSVQGRAAFELPSFDTSPDFDTTLYLDGKTSKEAPVAEEKEKPPPTKVRSDPVKLSKTLKDDDKENAKDGKQKEKDMEKQKRGRRASLIERRKSWLPAARSPSKVKQPPLPERPSTHAGDHVDFALVAAAAPAAAVSSGSAVPLTRPTEPERPRTVSESFATFAKKSWMSTSRAPSPKRIPESITQTPQPPTRPTRSRAPSNDSVKGASDASRKRPVSLLVDTSESAASKSVESLKPTSRALNRASTYFTKMKQRPTSMLVKLGSGSDSEINSSASAATRTPPPSAAPGNDQRGTASKPASKSASKAASSKQASSKPASCAESQNTVTDESWSEMSTNKDTVWSAFRSLDSEYAGFPSKAMAQRMQVVRATLLPFLRTYMNHTTNKGLNVEDVERRATVLNKWWGGLLEMLEGQGGHTLPGVDRPVLLEALTMLMMRPEWRQTTTYFMSLADRSPNERVRPRSGTQSTADSSLASSQAFLAESAEHNVRTMFVGNLMKQMQLVVDKMSLRHAPLSLVNWCGKACAYGFFFCPSVAEILVRLWDLRPELIRRTADEFGLPKKNNGESEDIMALFPPNLGVLGWQSQRYISNRFKERVKLSVMAARIPWFSPWVTRWRGGDTDLFFIFCKYFHILSEEFMPEGLPLLEKARSPGFVLVQAQILSCLESTIHRQAEVDAMMNPLPAADSFYGADAAATSMTVPGNLLKNMAENRLIVLLKDILGETGPFISAARRTFAETFLSVVRAATRRVSAYDHSAVFTLCDFLEEALVAYDDLDDIENPNIAKSIDWPFWLDVCRKMLVSDNAMTEVRLLSFIFSTWDTVAANPARKRALCLDWLLSEETFDIYFNHWCPMVRGYYMRLLCWRICRDAGSANEVDAEIFLVAASRLKTVWAHYLWLRNAAEAAGKFPPSTAPCMPTPGKKFMIIRTEVNLPQPGYFNQPFDSFSKILNGEGQVATTTPPATTGTPEVVPTKVDNQKKRWSLFGKVLSLGGAGSGSDSEDNEPVRKESKSLVSRSKPRQGGPPLPPKISTSAASAVTASSDGSSPGASPIFMEQKFVFKFTLTWQPPAVTQPRDRILTRPRLPAPAQAWVNARSRSGSTPPPPPAGLPDPTRCVSGSKKKGLVDEARNASPLSSPTIERKSSVTTVSSTSLVRRLSLSNKFDFEENPDAELLTFDFEGAEKSSASSMSSASSTASSPVESKTDEEQQQPLSPPPQQTQHQPIKKSGSRRSGPEPLTQPLRPEGLYTKRAVYTGRALAEWSIVVAECNGFVDRRRDEGVLGLSEVEVPLLTVEGFRKIG
ncbi:gpi inositol-deacylase [Colletotrichum plurivorum]|uniref:Gpi inositol-deacylase n=1 Tax=Colletotrichum plurivorum TaxID=2175906 RepID=A0A8H6NB04_9PEZI|nr:gpi inositol-deacylase [Colletotrichum plurivorum]